MYCNNCDKYFTQLSTKKKHEKHVSNIEMSISSLSLKLRNIRKKVYQNYHKKIYEAESIDESKSLSHKSKYKNKNEER